MKKSRRPRWAVAIALASAGLLSGCYYYPYGSYPWGYPYAGPYAWGYPYPPPPPPAPAGIQPTPLAPTPPMPPTGGAPVQRTPLPPAPQ